MRNEIPGLILAGQFGHNISPLQSCFRDAMMTSSVL